jgi:hypothetical protein
MHVWSFSTYWGAVDYVANCREIDKVRFPKRAEIFSRPQHWNLGPGPSRPPIQLIMWVWWQGIAQLVHATHHSLPSCVKVTYAWTYASSPTYISMVSSWTSHRDIFTFTFHFTLGTTLLSTKDHNRVPVVCCPLRGLSNLWLLGNMLSTVPFLGICVKVCRGNSTSFLAKYETKTYHHFHILTVLSSFVQYLMNAGNLVSS